MATQADVRRLALALPRVSEAKGRFAFEILHRGKAKGLAWVWLERLAPKQARVPNPRVLAVRVGSLASKNLILASDPTVFFTEPHYNGYPAVLVRLAGIRTSALRTLLNDAWAATAPPELRRTIEREKQMIAGAKAPRKKTGMR